MRFRSSAISDDHPAAVDDVDHRWARRFFWAVLVLASSASIAGNGAHTWVATDLAVPRALATAVAVAPPVTLMLSIEGVSMLVRTGRRSTATFRWALAMTLFLGVCAGVLSFDALYDLAVRSGVPGVLAYLWPVVVDVTIAQATIALWALSRPAPAADPVGEADFDVVPMPTDGEDHAQRAAVVLRTRKIRQSPEKVQRVLALNESGEKVQDIATHTKLHHSTVRRILVAAQAARTAPVAGEARGEVVRA